MAAEGVSMVETKKQEWSGIYVKMELKPLTKQVKKQQDVAVTLGK